VGNVHYIGWSLQVPCSTEPHQIVNSLQSLIVKMEKELNSWNDEIKDMRNDYYELNYYTTSQLLMLRQALVKFKLDEGIGMDADILALLYSIHPKIESHNVIKAITVAATNSVVMKPKITMEAGKNDELKDALQRTKYEGETHQFKAENSGLQILKEEELSDIQREIMSFIINQIYCTKELVLKIFHQHFSEDKNKYDYLQLCTQNQIDSDYDLSEDESVTSSEDSDSEDDTKIMVDDNQGAGQWLFQSE